MHSTYRVIQLPNSNFTRNMARLDRFPADNYLISNVIHIKFINLIAMITVVNYVNVYISINALLFVQRQYKQTIESDRW